MTLKPAVSPLDEPRIRAAFEACVNMSAGELARWLKTDESLSVGWKRRGESESIGHASGRRIVDILGRDDATESDLAHMRKVVGYIRRHLAQRPRGDVSRTRWRYSLMNWGHDPLKD
jgi:hypothetical protein